MARKRKGDDETVEAIYGINRDTLKVERIWVTRGGLMTRMGADMVSYSHQIEHGRRALAEAVIVFGLVEVVAVSAMSLDGEYERQVREKLEAKVARVKAGEEKL